MKTELVDHFRSGVRVGLSDTLGPTNRPGQRKARLLLEVLRDREADVLRFTHDLKVPPPPTRPNGTCDQPRCNRTSPDD
jgi:transposase